MQQSKVVALRPAVPKPRPFRAAKKPAPAPTHFLLDQPTRLAWSSAMAYMQNADRIMRGTSVPVAKTKELQMLIKRASAGLAEIGAKL